MVTVMGREHCGGGGAKEVGCGVIVVVVLVAW